jgi:signal transduction histidine kinase
MRDDVRVTVPVGWILALCAGSAVLLALSVSTQTYLTMLTHGHSFARLFLWQLAVWSFWVAAAPAIVRLGVSWVERRPPSTVRRSMRVAGLGFATVALHVPFVIQLMVWMNPYAPVPRPSFATLFQNQLPFLSVRDVFVFALLFLAGVVPAVRSRATALELQQSRLQMQLAQAHLDALRLEIEPHFLFNTLNSIAALIRVNENRDALAMLLKLGDLMRSTLERPRDQLVALGEEIAFVRHYVDLQQARFQERLSVEYAFDAEAAALAVPSFLFQPLVENALRHGAGHLARGCRIEIGGRRERTELCVWVEDDGAGLATDFSLARHAGTGLTNIQSRLQQIFGPAAKLTLTPRGGGGARAEIRVPAMAAATAAPISRAIA